MSRCRVCSRHTFNSTHHQLTLNERFSPTAQVSTVRYGCRMSNVLRFPSNGRDRAAGEPPTPEPLLRDVVGDVLRDERLEQGRTLSDVADDAAVSLPYLSEVERGRKEVSSDVLASICDALELPLVEVLQRSAQRLRVEGRAQRGSGIQLMAA